MPETPSALLPRIACDAAAFLRAANCPTMAGVEDQTAQKAKGGGALSCSAAGWGNFCRCA
jgi:hypothetical protein